MINPRGVSTAGGAKPAREQTWRAGMSNIEACQWSVGEARAAWGVYPLKGVTVGKSVGCSRRAVWLGRFRKVAT
jgi:hypothetical protein